MAGSAVSELIFFTAALLISASVAVALVEIVEDYSASLRDEASLLNADMRARVTIVNDPFYVPYDGTSGDLSFYLKNTGTSGLSLDDIVVSANGTARSGSSLTASVLGGGSLWSPGRTVEVVFSVPDLTEGTDYHGWASTSGLTEEGMARGNAQDTIVFRVTEV